MKAWGFSTKAYPPAERASAWRDAMYRLGLPVGDIAESEPPSASVTCLTSPLGMEFALIDAGAQTISGRRTDLPAAIWLAILLEGHSRIESDGVDQAMAAGDIAFGPSGRAATLVMETQCRLMFVRAPRVALDHRLIAVRGLKVGRLETDTGMIGVLSGLLTATARSLPNLTVDQLRPVELALTEFLAAALAEKTLGESLSGGGSPHLHRISQTIETLLPDPDLSLRRLADVSGVSPRYIQKLFATANDTFGHYLRTRRLERSRMDLSSPLCARLSISEICFRWGFNDSAHFSRAFRNQYGLSPREHRRAAAAESAP
ncbi:MAG TPA: helix-turn-helix domain-containing protein [Caulobacteraceae bacterium]|jgi:AraC-like DNA-binding protein